MKGLGSKGIVVNIARGAVMDETALLQALRQKTIGGEAVDVFVNEPDINPAPSSPYRVLCWPPHQASVTVETRDAMG